ncbi:MAG: tripartite tricarboxylate transporter substrate binding protein [Burkholderiales bacterium]|nr:tripartite tricarboxylate transporter substrate binding protein [Burkholderiales bacterium]
MKPTRRATTAAAIAVPALLASLLAHDAAAQSWPAKPVRVVTPWAAGGLTDIVGRIVFQKISENLGQQFMIDNRAGAAGTIGADIVAKAPADGYTLMVHSMAHVVNPFVYAKLPYDTLNDFVGIGTLVRQTGLLVVHPSLPVKSVKDLVALARARPDQLFYSTAGSGSFSHLAVALLGSMSGTRMVDVPYKGGGPATAALVSGEAQLSAGTPASVSTHLGTNRLRLIAVTSDTRLTAFPKTPTVAESGVPGYEYAGWVGVFAPAGLPKPLVDRINAEIARAMDSPDTKKRLEEFEPWTTTPAQMAARIRQDYEKHSKLMKVAGIKPL